jgi:hypothetical protein
VLVSIITSVPQRHLQHKLLKVRHDVCNKAAAQT